MKMKYKDMTFNEFKDILLSEFPDLSEKQIEQFRQLEELYKEWNSRINVISRKDIDELYKHHVLHSLCIAAYAKRCGSEILAPGSRVLDLGTGGGFPGIPLAIIFPNCHFTLCDSIGKKITVASAVAESLKLENTECVNARAETLPSGFDWVVSRAVTALDNFIPWVKGKYNKGILYLKGGDISEELATAMGHHKLQKGSVMLWKAEEWLKDEYFSGKYVIHIKK